MGKKTGKKKKAIRNHIRHAGFSIPAAAKEIPMPEGTLRRAVGDKQVEYVEFAGLRRIPPREIERLREMLGIVPLPPRDNERPE
jgi:hypothetical protein